MAFHVLESARIRTGGMGSDLSYGNNGAFDMPSPDPSRNWGLIIVASDGEGWKHVSVHAYRISKTIRTPSWLEMCYVKDLFWDPEDVVVQFHPRHSEYVNQHPHTLHLWRPIGVEILTPPPVLVGYRDG